MCLHGGNAFCKFSSSQSGGKVANATYLYLYTVGTLLASSFHSGGKVANSTFVPIQADFPFSFNIKLATKAYLKSRSKNKIILKI